MIGIIIGLGAFVLWLIGLVIDRRSRWRRVPGPVQTVRPGGLAVDVRLGRPTLELTRDVTVQPLPARADAKAPDPDVRAEASAFARVLLAARELLWPLAGAAESESRMLPRPQLQSIGGVQPPASGSLTWKFVTPWWVRVRRTARRVLPLLLRAVLTLVMGIVATAIWWAWGPGP